MVVALVVAIVHLALMAESVQHLSIFLNRGVSASSARHLEQYKKGVGRWRHSQEALYLENGSAKDLYPVNNVGRILLGLYSQPMLFWDKISMLRDLSGACDRVPVLVKTVQQDISRTGPQNSYTR